MRHVEAGSNLALGKRTLMRTQAADLLEGNVDFIQKAEFQDLYFGFGECFELGVPCVLSQVLSWAPGTEV